MVRYGTNVEDGGIPVLAYLRHAQGRSWTTAGGATCAFVATALLLLLATRTAIARIAEPAVSTTTVTPSAHPAGEIHPTTIAGIPGLIAIPDHLVSSTPVVVMYHGFGPPASPEALAKSLPPVPDAISFYPWLPLFGPRMGADGTNDLVQRQADDYVGRLLFPVMAQAAAELPKIVEELSALYHLSNRRPLVVFGFSAGGAVALLSLTESGVRPRGVIVVNAPLSISQAVDGYERQLGHRYYWTKAARHAAIRYDVGAHASQIARQHRGTAFLFVQSDHDAGYSSAEANSVAMNLKAAASRYTPEPDIGAVIVPNSDHYVLDSIRPKDPKAKAAEATARTLVCDWISRRARKSGEQGTAKSASGLEEVRCPSPKRDQQSSGG
jgi:predicted esterase